MVQLGLQEALLAGFVLCVDWVMHLTAKNKQPSSLAHLQKRPVKALTGYMQNTARDGLCF